MPSHLWTRPRTGTVALAAIGVLLLGSCGTEEDPDAAAASTTSEDGSPNSLEALLPTAEDLPGLGENWRWRPAGSEPAANDRLGVCTPMGAQDIGAERGTLRRYAPRGGTGGGATAIALQFPDRATAEHALDVLVTAHGECQQHLRSQGHDDVRVSPLQQVPAKDARAWWYRASWTAEGGDTGRFQSSGIVLGGQRIVLVTIDAEGKEHDPPPGEEPMADVVELVAGLFPPAG